MLFNNDVLNNYVQPYFFLRNFAIIPFICCSDFMNPFTFLKKGSQINLNGLCAFLWVKSLKIICFLSGERVSCWGKLG